VTRLSQVCSPCTAKLAAIQGVKTAFSEIGIAGAEMGAGATEDDAAAVVSSGRDHHRVGGSRLDRGDDDRLRQSGLAIGSGRSIPAAFEFGGFGS